MRKTLSVIMIGLAIVFTMIAVGVHHHHHGEMMYLPQQEYCGEGQTGSDQHEEEETSDHTQHYLASSNIKIDAAAHTEASRHGLSFSIPCVCGNTTEHLQPFVPSRRNNDRCPADGDYLSWLQRCRGLRAPPCA